jgi:hypothetical protein
MKRQQKYNRTQMYALIRECEASGISQEKFFKERGVAKGTFGYWRRKYLKENGIDANQGRNFIPVKIDAPVEEPSQKAESFIELYYPNGVRLTCSGEIDLSRLKTLIIL